MKEFRALNGLVITQPVGEALFDEQALLPIKETNGKRWDLTEIFEGTDSAIESLEELVFN